MAWGDVDGDGDLDLAVGNSGYPQTSRVYRNDRGKLTTTTIWSSPGDGYTQSVAWGDVDGDGDLDLAVGNSGQPSHVYLNNEKKLTTETVWSSPESDFTQSVAWGDVDGDGDLDLAVGNYGQPSHVYLNDGGTLTTTTSWSSPGDGYTQSVAWGDVDGDGDLDLAVGNYEQPSRVYRNDGKKLTTETVWSSPEGDNTQSVAWGDVDGDGDLDLAVGNSGQPSQVSRNDGAMLTTEPAWSSPEGGDSQSVAWGDVDDDGDLDLAVGNYGQPSHVYLNDGGTLTTTTSWSSPGDGYTQSVAWGDVDGDGDLDLAVGNDGQPSRVYRNDGKKLTTETVWSSPEGDNTQSVAWGDVDGDGDLDLAVGNDGQPSHVYLNDGGTLTTTTSWSSPERDSTRSVAWGDVDGDGDLDLAVGNYGYGQTSRVYRNDEGRLTTETVWLSIEYNYSRSVAWGDMDGDGDLDLAVSNYYDPLRVYRNDSGHLTTEPAWSSPQNDDTRIDTTTSVAWGDMDGDGDLDLAVANDRNIEGDNPNVQSRIYQNINGVAIGKPFTHPPTVMAQGPQKSGGAAFYATAGILDNPIIPVSYILKDAENNRVAGVRAEYSLDGGGHWQPAIAASGTITTSLTATPTGTPYIFQWDTLASGVFGTSDNVVFRIHAIPDVRPRPPDREPPFSSISSSYLYGSTQSTTSPFRLRGTQPQVFDDNGKALAGTQVYRLPAGDDVGATPVAEPSGRTFRTNQLGYLEGRGQITLGDRLVALQEITHTAQYTMYFTSAAPNADGLGMVEVTQPGVQKLTVSSENPLMLFNVSVSLEWDARKDVDFMRRLREDLQRVSGTLYGWSDGQIALGTVTIYQNKEHWNDTFDAKGNLESKGADIRVRATNHLRPNASQGGITTQVFSETITRSNGVPSKIIYEPGSVRLGAVWNSDGSPDLREESTDWALALAHELGHYALYLDDNYLGLNNAGQLVTVTTCPGAMSNPYDTTTIDFRPDGDWQRDCANTLSNRTTGRSDWATIKQFYDNKVTDFKLNQPDSYRAKPGPSHLPLAVTQFVEPVPAVAAEAHTRSLPLVQASGGSYTPSAAARAFAFTNKGFQVRDLGQPTNGRVIARGVQAGDEVCVFDLPAARLGCASLGSSSLITLNSRSDWQPDIVLTPRDPRTITIEIPADGVGTPRPASLAARLFPTDTQQASTDTTLVLTNGTYKGVFTTAESVLEGTVRVWVENDSGVQRVAVTDYAVGGNPAPPRQPPRRSRRKAPVVSSDGQVILFTDGLDFNDGEFFSLQTVTHLPDLPATATPIGTGYRLITSRGAPPLTGVSINMAFAQDDLPPGSDQWVAVYYYPLGGTKWQRLSPLPGARNSTEVNAQVKGPGIYVVMASQELTIGQEGWNQFAYPGADAPLPDALQPITGSYRLIYGYDAEAIDPFQAWQAYAPHAPPWVNELNKLEHDQPYWVYVADRLTAAVKPAVAAAGAEQPQAGSPLPFPPALFYGVLDPTPDFTPAPGMLVQAKINDVVCGEALTQKEGDSVIVVIDVLAASSGATARCGYDGASITFTIGDYVWPATREWDNTQLNILMYQFRLPVVSHAHPAISAPEAPPGETDPGE